MPKVTEGFVQQAMMRSAGLSLQPLLIAEPFSASQKRETNNETKEDYTTQ